MRALLLIRLALALAVLVQPACTQVLGDFTLTAARSDREAGPPGDATDPRAADALGLDGGLDAPADRSEPSDGDAASQADAPAETTTSAPSLAITPAVGDYGQVVLGTSAAKSFDIFNQGAGQTGLATVALSTGDAAGGSFTIENNGCLAGITAGQTCSVAIRFAPLSLGAAHATLVVGADPGGSVMVDLKGTGVAQGALVLDEIRHDFSPIVLGSQSAAAIFTVTNTGDSDTSPLSAQIDTTTDFQIASDTCGGGVLAGHATCTVSVVFAPANAGVRTGSLAIVASTGGITRASLSGTGQRPAALLLAPAAGASTDFGAVLVGTTRDHAFVLSNAGDESTGVLAVTAPAGQFALLAAAAGDCRSGATILGGGETCTLRVRFTPATAGGAESAGLAVSASPGGAQGLTLRATGQTPAVLTFAPAAGSAVNFGVVVLGSVKDQTFLLSNTGQQTSGPLVLPALTGAFGILPPRDGDCVPGLALDGGDGCTVRVRFVPSAGAAAMASLAVTGTPGGSVSLSLRGTGQTGAALRLSPNATFSTDFGSVVVGALREQTFTLTNTGQQATTTITLPAVAAPFALVQPSGTDCVSGVTTLAGGGVCTIRVRFAPIASGPATATLSATATLGGRAPLALTGSGQTAARLTLAVATGSSTDFGTVLVDGVTSRDELFTVTNAGQQAASPMTIRLAGSTSFLASFTLPAPGTGECRSGTAGTALQSGVSCTIRVRFRPTVGSALTGTVTVTATTGGSASLTLLGAGQSPAVLTLAPDTGSAADYGSVVIGATRDQTFTVTNAGQQRSSAVTVSSSSSNFRVLPTAGDCVSATTTLGPSASCTVHVRFAPTSIGSASATLSARATTGGTASLAISGAGQAILALTLLSVDAGDFGTVAIGTRVARTYRLTNLSNGALATTAAPLTIAIVAPSEPFLLGPTTCGAQLMAGATCDISVYFTPAASGSYARTLQAAATVGGTATAELRGAAP